MIFRELIIENFGPYVGRQVINLDPEIDGNICPIILFGGMNGGGKTTLIDAIRLALYGARAQCSTRGNLSYSDFLAQSVNRSASPVAQTRIELSFEIIEDGDLKKFKIVRYWEANPKEGKDTLGILEYGDADGWKDEALTNTWDQYIENLLPIGISNLFLFDGEQVKELAEQEVPPPVVVQAIQSLLGLELSERLGQDLEILANRKRKETASAKELLTLAEIEQKLNQQEADLVAANDELTGLNEQVILAEAKYQQALNQFVAEGGKVARDRTLLETQQRELQERAEIVQKDLKELAAESLPLALISPLLVQAQGQGIKEQRHQEAKAAWRVLQERDRRLINYITEQAFSVEKVAKIQGFLQAENQDLEKEIATNESSWLLAEAEQLTQLDELLKLVIPGDVTKATGKLAELEKLEVDIDALERQIATAAAPEDYQELENLVKVAQKEFFKTKADCEIAQRRCDELQKAIAKTKKDLAEYAAENLKLKSNQHIITSIAKVQVTLKLFREKLTLKKLNKLELEVTECFRYLLHKSDLVHRLAIDTETFRISLYDPDGKILPKHRLSAGEKQLLAIAFLWGLARVSGRKLPVVIDTPLGRLDSSHRQNLVERYFPYASHQVILLSTDTEIGQMEFERLGELEAIARSYLLKYHPGDRYTTVEKGYFWDN